MVAAIKANTEVVSRLLKAHADTNAKEMHGKTAGDLVDLKLQALGQHSDKELVAIREALSQTQVKLPEVSLGVPDSQQLEFDKFLEQLRHADWSWRKGAATRLGELGDPRAVTHLTTALSDPKWEVARAASDALRHLLPGEKAEMLIRKTDLQRASLAQASPDWMVRARTAQELGSSGYPEALSLLERALADNNWAVRTATATAMGAMRLETAVAALTRALSDSEQQVRDAAADALKLIGCAEGEKALIEHRRRITPPTVLLTINSAGNACALSSDTTFLVTVGREHTVRIWDVRTGAERGVLHGHAGNVTACAISHDSNFVVTGSMDTTLKIWDVVRGVEQATLRGHLKGIRSLAISQDDSFVVSTAFDAIIRIWDVSTGTERAKLEAGFIGSPTCAISHDGSFIAWANRAIIVWDVASGTRRTTLNGHTETINALAVSPDGSFIASASDDETLRIWDVATGTQRMLLKPGSKVKACAVSPDGSVVAAGSWKIITIWDASSGKQLATLRGHSGPGLIGEIEACAISRDGALLVSVASDCTRIWDLATALRGFVAAGLD